MSIDTPAGQEPSTAATHLVRPEPASSSPPSPPQDAAASPSSPAPPASLTGAYSAANDPLIGTVIAGRYRLIQRVGEGGMGAVYRGEHVTLRKRVAVKFLHAELSRINDVVARFEREAVAAANLEHPNVVAAHDFGKAENGLFFLVMEFVDGGSLRDLLTAEKRLAPMRALHIARHIAAALNRAHALGIVHRDLKPENVVLVEREGDRDFAKVIDFGIAKVSPEKLGSGGGGQALTQAGMVFGTPDYMAPEQALGSKVDHRADLYAYGVMVFEMLVGQRPFHADDVMALLGKHMTAPPPSASAMAPPGELPPAVDAVLARILAKSPNDRFDSAVAFIHALEAALGFAPQRLVTGMTPAFGVNIPSAPVAITGNLTPPFGVTNNVPAAVTGPAHALAASAAPGVLTGPYASLPNAAGMTGPNPAYVAPSSVGLPSITGVGPAANTAGPGSTQKIGAAGSSLRLPAPLIAFVQQLRHALAASVADVRRSPRHMRLTAAALGGLVLLATVTVIARRPRHPSVGPVPVVPQSILRGRPGPNASPEIVTQHPTPERPAATPPVPTGPGLPPALAARLDAYRSQPSVAVLLDAARGRRRRAVINAFEQTRGQAPGDPIVTYLLGGLYARERGGGQLAVERYAEAVRLEPGFARDAALAHDVVEIYAEARRPPPQAEALIAGPLFDTALPQLVDVAMNARTAATRNRAIALLDSPSIGPRVDPTSRALVDLASARSCEQKRAVVVRLGQTGDARALPHLRRLPLSQRCGFFGMGQCPSCLAEAVPAAIQAIERRTGSGG